MREIKFRAWDKKAKRMYEDVQDVYDSSESDDSLIQEDCFGFILGKSKYEVMQYTGLKDKNGIDYIYEGDIIGLDGLKKGDKYENPNLLEEKTNLLIEGMGTKAWRNAEQKAMERGCFYSK